MNYQAAASELRSLRAEVRALDRAHREQVFDNPRTLDGIMWCALNKFRANLVRMYWFGSRSPYTNLP